jgi:hypothetical protein
MTSLTPLRGVRLTLLLGRFRGTKGGKAVALEDVDLMTRAALTSESEPC